MDTKLKLGARSSDVLLYSGLTIDNSNVHFKKREGRILNISIIKKW